MATMRGGGSRGPVCRSKTLVRALPKRGLCSRTEAFRLIRSGHVSVNRKVVSDPNCVIRQEDRISVGGRGVLPGKRRYIIFNKPAGCVTTRSDERGAQTVYDLLGDVGGWVFPVGRLDKDTEGLLLFTNDTAFGDFLADPVNKVKRTYRATVAGTLSDAEVARAGRGVDIGRGEVSRPAAVNVLRRGADATVLEIALTEGRNREVRRLCKALGARVTRLVRTHYGPFDLEGLPPGRWRELDAGLCERVYRRK